MSAAQALAPPRAEALPRLLAGASPGGPAVSLDDHLLRYGPPPGARGLAGLVDAAGLRGRGGAGFPTGRKLAAVAGAGRRPIVVANGVEGEPVSSKDRTLMRHVPHLVLDGASLAAAAVGAREAIVAVGSGGRGHIDVLRAALAERRRRRVDRVSIRLEPVPQRFVAGEETALVSWLNGGPPKPTFTPPRPFERGVGRAPTLVQNVETLANVALIARYGPGWFRLLGTREEPGTALVTLGGAVAAAGVYEVPLGLPLPELLEWAGGATVPVRAFLVGGYFGTWVPAADALRCPLSDAGLASSGASLGARTIYALPERTCGLRQTARAASYLAGESAGQCGPCVHGLAAIAAALERLARPGADPADVRRVERWSGQVEGRGACRHPDGAVRLVRSALTVFADELERHVRGRCTAPQVTGHGAARAARSTGSSRGRHS